MKGQFGPAENGLRRIGFASFFSLNADVHGVREGLPLQIVWYRLDQLGRRICTVRRL